MTEQERVIPYKVGICFASACAAAEAGRAEIEEALNAEHPTGVGPWRISNDPTFATGQTNPCGCNLHADRRHWLLSC